MTITMQPARARRYTAAVAKGTQLTLRVSPAVIEQLDAVAAAVPGLTRHTVARVAIERGLAEMATDPRYGGKPPATRRRK